MGSEQIHLESSAAGLTDFPVFGPFLLLLSNPFSSLQTEFSLLPRTPGPAASLYHSLFLAPCFLEGDSSARHLAIYNLAPVCLFGSISPRSRPIPGRRHHLP